jgi:hypothetical protein
MRIIIVGITPRGSQLSGRERTGNAYEIVGVAVRPQTAKEDATICWDDIALMEDRRFITILMRYVQPQEA